MVFEKIKEIVAVQLDINKDEIEMESSLEDLGADSLDIIGITIMIDEEFGIEMPEDEALKLETVGEFVRYVEGKI